MARPVTLFTGQWADLPLTELAAKCGEWGFDGLELACWGDHFDVGQAVSDPGYAKGQRELLARGRGLRRDAALIEQRSPRDGEVSLT
jgi:sugar phosphate isomerase/epimerase